MSIPRTRNVVRDDALREVALVLSYAKHCKIQLNDELFVDAPDFSTPVQIQVHLQVQVYKYKCT